MSLPEVPNPAQVVLELPPGYEGSGDPRPRSAEPTAVILASGRLRRNRCPTHAMAIDATAPGAGTACGAADEPNTHASALPSVSARSPAPNIASSHWPFTSVQ